MWKEQHKIAVLADDERVKPSFHRAVLFPAPSRALVCACVWGVLSIFAVQGASAQSSSGSKPGLDKKFYNDYLDSLPNEKKQRVELLEKNLLRVAVRAISREDSQDGPAFVKDLKNSALRYEQVNGESPFVRGIFRELPYLRTTPFMWVIQAGPYTIFVSFRVDPRRFICEEFQLKAVKETPKDQPEPKDPHGQ